MIATADIGVVADDALMDGAFGDHPASEHDRPRPKPAQAQWCKYQGRIDPSRPAFIGATWTKINMTHP